MGQDKILIVLAHYMCSYQHETPYRTYDPAGWLLSPVRESIYCSYLHETPHIVPVTSDWGLDLVAAGLEVNILLVLLTIALFSKLRVAKGPSRVPWRHIATVCLVAIALFSATIIIVSIPRVTSMPY